MIIKCFFFFLSQGLVATTIYTSASEVSSSKNMPSKEVSEEERSLESHFIEDIVHFELQYESDIFILTRNGELVGKDGSKKSSKSLQKLAKRNQKYSSLLFGDIALIDSGSDSFEGYISQVDVIDLEAAKVLSTFQKCSNQPDSFFTYKSQLYYYCEFHCSTDKIHRLNKSAKSFEEVLDASLCSKVPRLKEVKFNKAKVKRSKEK